MNAVIYARYSSDRQREESIEGQLRECTDYAMKNNLTLLGTYVDRALSARTADRPDFQRMIADSAKGLFDVVLVWKLDRFSRDRYDSAHYKHVLKKNGVRVISIKENISDGPEGIILESMLEGYAEYYSAELAQKIRRGQHDNAMKCMNNGGNTPLGYYVDKTTGRLEIDPETAPYVQELFARYADGERLTVLQAEMEERGLRSKRGNAYSISVLSNLLKNRKYIGEYKYRDVIIPDGIPAIIDKELFERVQMRMAANKKAPARAKAEEEYLLTTKLYCGDCGRLMAGESGKGCKGIYLPLLQVQRCQAAAWLQEESYQEALDRRNGCEADRLQGVDRRGNRPYCRCHPCYAGARRYYDPSIKAATAAMRSGDSKCDESDPPGYHHRNHKGVFGRFGNPAGFTQS